MSAQISGAGLGDGNETIAAYARLWDIFLLSQAVEDLNRIKSFKNSDYFKEIDSYFNVDGKFRLIDSFRKVASGVSENINAEGINQTTIKKLGEIIAQDDKYQLAREALKKYLDQEFSGVIILMIDGLDQGISNERGAEGSKKLINICKGLYLALNRLTTSSFSSKLHIKSCLPNDIFFHFSMRDADKFERAHAIKLFWDSDHLKTTINKRLNSILGIDDGLKDTWSKITPSTIKAYFYNLAAPIGQQVRDRSTWEVIIEHSFNRPRDIIVICNEIFQVAEKNNVSVISHIEITEGIKNWANDNYIYLIAEAKFSDERIEKKLNSFRGKHQAYKYSKFVQILMKKDLNMGSQAVEETIFLLYKLGFIGVGTRKKITSPDDSNTTFYDIEFSYQSTGMKASIGALSDSDTIYFHPALVFPLALSPGIEK